ncbi:MAG: 2-oxo acid dehydrogenase subunit E2 [Candidatus Zixiibacteriota bacterium]|nr:MAG: 2-oxo acid dehydrogenase subunit E2 [candidate division Zixibacteria bacterium]
MALDVLVPQMGESVLEGTILEWKVKVGEPVKLNQVLVELMTDKVNVEIPAEIEGILTHQFAKEGEVVPVGTRIAVIDDGKGPATKAEAAPKKAAPEAPAQPAAAPPTPKPRAEIKATAEMGKGKMSPKVRMMIREYSVDPLTVTPTGKEGRVTVDDVMRAVEERSQAAGFTPGPIPAPPAPMVAVPSAPPAEKAPAPEKAREPLVKVEIPVFEPLPAAQRETRTPLAGIRKMISDHMVKSVHTSPHVTTFEDIDFTELVKYREEIKNSFVTNYGAKITYMPFIIKAACLALKEFPKINASMTEKEIIFKNYYNIGVAVAREEGLIVPVIKNADKKTIVELAVELNSIGERARTNQLMPDDVSGGTFSITNAGMFGAASSTPIINQPQVAILGVHAIIKKPWVVKGEIVIRDISNFGLSFDHRLIDGHIAVQFLHRIHEYLADPRLLLMQLR